MPVPLIELSHLTRRVPGTDHPLVDDLSVTIQPGDRIGIAGASGSGKSTLLRSIARLDPVHQAEWQFQGQPLLTNIPVFRRQVVYLHQSPAMVNGTTRDNLQLPFAMQSSLSDFDQQKIVQWLHLLGKPSSILDQMVDTLSGGEQQLIALLRAIQIQPLVLLLDEPTAALDGETTQRYEQLVDTWFADATGRALVWIGHDENQLQRMTSTIWRMSSGKIVQ